MANCRFLSVISFEPSYVGVTSRQSEICFLTTRRRADSTESSVAFTPSHHSKNDRTPSAHPPLSLLPGLSSRDPAVIDPPCPRKTDLSRSHPAQLGAKRPTSPRKWPRRRPRHVAWRWVFVLITSAVSSLIETMPTDLVATLSESTASTFLPSLHASMVAHPEGRQIMRDRPNISSDILENLRGLRRGTLGREYLEWLERGDVTPDTREPVSVFECIETTLFDRC